MENVKLELNFLDEINKKFKVTIRDPKLDLKKEDIKSTIDAILNEKVFSPRGVDLKDIDSVNRVTTHVEEIVLE